MNFILQNTKKLTWWKGLAIAVIVYIFDFIWYMPQIAGGEWMKSVRMDESMMQNANMTPIFIVSFIATLLIVYGYAAFISNNNTKNALRASMAITCLIAIPNMVISGMYGMFTLKYMFLSGIGFIIGGMIIGYLVAKWRKA